jgi:DNA-binding PadR family transcriptional regulator
MSATRLLVLGAVHILQPAHGYLVMRELSTWKVDEWANLKPGSIYNALRTLTKAGLLTEEREEGGSGGGRSVYRLTPDGDVEFERLVRQALWELHPWDFAILPAGISFWSVLSRDEVLSALEARRTQITAWLSANGYAQDGILRTPTTPNHVVEHFRLAGSRMQGELEWTEQAAERVKNGDYAFRGEDISKLFGPGAFPPQPPPAPDGY